MSSDPTPEEDERGVQEEARMEESLPDRREIMRRVEEKRKVMSERARSRMYELAGVESELSEREHRLQELESEVGKYLPEPQLSVTNILQDPRMMERLMKMMGESDDPMKMAFAYTMLQDVQTRQLINQMLQLELLDRFRERLGGRRGYVTEEDVRRIIREELKSALSNILKPKENGELMEKLRKLEEAIEELKKSGWEKEASELKEAVMKLVEANSPDKMIETVNKLMELVGKLKGEAREVGATSAEEELEKVARILENVRKIVSSFAQPTHSFSTKQPLAYEGQAPWWFHPDARVAVKDLVDGILRSITNAISSIEGAKKGHPPSGLVKSEKKYELPEELRW